MPEESTPPPSPPAAPAAPPAPPAAPTAPAATQTPAAPVAVPGVVLAPDTPASHDMIRKVHVSRTATSKYDVPHIALTVECRVDKVLDAISAMGDEGVTLGDFAVKAACASMREVPMANSAFFDGFIRRYNNVDVNIGVSTPSGLVFPLLRGAQAKGIRGLASERSGLSAQLTGEGLKADEYAVGTFTIADLSNEGPLDSAPVLTPPQACSLALGNLHQKTVQQDGDFVQAQVVTATLSCDHRVVDGAVGAEWLKAFQRRLENPLEILY